MTAVTEQAVRETREFLQQRQSAYRLAFGSPAGQEVLKDLLKFCRARKTTFNADPRVHAALEGRREVWLRIEDHIGLTLDELFELASGYKVQRLMQQDGSTTQE